MFRTIASAALTVILLSGCGGSPTPDLAAPRSDAELSATYPGIPVGQLRRLESLTSCDELEQAARRALDMNRGAKSAGGASGAASAHLFAGLGTIVFDRAKRLRCAWATVS